MPAEAVRGTAGSPDTPEHHPTPQTPPAEPGRRDPQRATPRTTSNPQADGGKEGPPEADGGGAEVVWRREDVAGAALVGGCEGAREPGARERLAAAQERVVAALVTGAAMPEGFDPDRLRVQAASLVAKRRSVVAKLRPDAAMAAGADLVSEFAAYAAARTTPPTGYRNDADDFAAWLQERGLMAVPERRRRWRDLLPRRRETS